MLLRSTAPHPRHEARTVTVWASVALLLVLLPGGCASGPRSTRMTVDDFNAMATEMAASLAESEAFAERGPDSEPWVVSIERVLNLSSDVMTTSEQWAVIARLRSSTPLQSLADRKNVRFLMAADRAAAMQEQLADEGDGDSDFTRDRTAPTHVMTATFRSVTRADDTARTETYYCEFELLEYGTSEPVWIDRFEYKREAFGHIWD